MSLRIMLLPDRAVDAPLAKLSERHSPRLILAGASPKFLGVHDDWYSPNPNLFSAHCASPTPSYLRIYSTISGDYGKSLGLRTLNP